MGTFGFKIEKLLFSFGIGILLAACQSTPILDIPKEEKDINICFQISAPEELGTRLGGGSNSRLGGLDNVDFEKYDLRYQLAIYRLDGEQLIEAVSPQTKIVDTYSPVTYSLQLTPDRQYRVVVWADFVLQGTTNDLHYNTVDLRDITIANNVVNDESKDAFFIAYDFKVEDKALPLVLKRPFAKLRVVTTDWNKAGLIMPENFKVTYFGCKHFDHFDAATGFSKEELLTDTGISYFGSINKAEKEYTEDYDSSETNRTIIVDYLLTEPTQQSAIHFKMEAYGEGQTVASRIFDTDIPIQRNWLTTIIGNTLSQDNNTIIEIDNDLDNKTK